MAQLEEEEYFFELPYRSSLLIRHNLDMMHIEKNICESILGTLLEIEGKCKDSENAHLNMEHIGIRQDQHLVIEDDEYTLPVVLYSLENDDKMILYQFLQSVKMPDGFCSNLKRCVDDKTCKVSRLKTHDCQMVRSKQPTGVLIPVV
jgi:hypothetical protein